MRIAIGAGLIVVGALVAVLMVEPFVLNSAKGMEQEGRYDEEVEMLRDAEQYVPWGGGIARRLDDALIRRVEQELQRDRIDLAVRAFREAWARARARGFAQDERFMMAGLTVYARGAERFRAHGEKSMAADWNDSLFAFAVRAPNDDHRAAALAAFTEGLNLRVDDGEPCAALARVRWARRGLGGIVPGLDPSVEVELENQCRAARRKEARRR